MEPARFGKRLMGLLRAVYHMLRRGLCRKRLMMDLHLLLGRGKLAGKALRDLLTAAAAHHPHHLHGAHHMVVPSSSSSASRAAASSSSSSSSTASAPAGSGGSLSFAYDPRDVEFSCTTTPSSAAYSLGAAAPAARPARALFPFRVRGRSGGARQAGGCDGLDFAQVARALEMMHADDELAAAAAAAAETPSSVVAAGATPSPMLALSLGRSPVGVRRLRVTDSPFPVEPDQDGRADSTFDAFISRFYESLRLQQADATPDSHPRRRG